MSDNSDVSEIAVNEQEKLETKFTRAESFWNASLQVILRSDRDFLNSFAIVRTASGLAGKREFVCVQTGVSEAVALRIRYYRPSLKSAMRDAAPWLFIASMAAAAIGTIFLALRVYPH